MQYGRLLAQNTEEGRLVFLYRVQTFYVAAAYERLEGQLAEITSYVDVDQLVPHYRKHLISIHPAEREYDTPEL